MVTNFFCLEQSSWETVQIIWKMKDKLRLGYNYALFVIVHRIDLS